MLFRFTWLAVALGVLGAACLLFWGRRGEMPARPAAAPPGRAKILQFYAREGALPRGDATLLCYGVENARAVRITPLAEALTPAFSRCVEVKPEQTTHYTLVAEGHDGTAVTRSFTVQVLPPAPRQIVVEVDGT